MPVHVAVVTNEMLHHKYLAAELANSVDVRCILHPHGTDDSRAKRARTRGLAWAGLKMMSVAYRRLSSRSSARMIDAASERMLVHAADDYAKLDPGLIHHLDTVNSPTAVKLMEDNEIDVVCFLGGDLARADFINSPRMACLNIHSGLSPFYNGSSSSVWAVAEGRPNFSGITLMHMNERIDGGRVIAHHLPSITADDTAASLFVKGVKGAVELYCASIKQLEDGTMFDGIPQQRSFKYTTGMDWTIYQDLKLAAFQASGRMKVYEREERTIFYNQAALEADFPYGELLSLVLAKAGA